MEIIRWHYYILFNCVLIQYLEAKTFSLNDVIAAESQLKETSETTLPSKLTASIGKSNSLIQRLSSTSKVKKLLQSGLFKDNTATEGKLSPLKYKKTFQIKSPLKPKKLKFIQKSRFKRKNQSTKREIHGNEKLKEKYIPLLKSLSMLFDNLINSDESESLEVKTKKYKRNRFFSAETFDVPCNCTKSDSSYIESNSEEKTITISTPVSATISVITNTPTSAKATSTKTNNITTRDFGPFRQYKDIPILLPRNTSSPQRDYNGISERSSAALYGNVERNISRYNGNYEHTTESGKNKPSTENDEKNTDGVARYGAGGFRYPRTNRIRNITPIISRGNETNENYTTENETTDDPIRGIQIKPGRNETESTRLLQEPLRRSGLRGFRAENVNQSTKPVQSKDVHTESVFDVTHNITGNKRITDRGSEIATEIQKVRERNETINNQIATEVQKVSERNETVNTDNWNTTSSKITPKKSPVVMIFDGYSITRHKNGENKYSEKSIRIHS